MSEYFELSHAVEWYIDNLHRVTSTTFDVMDSLRNRHLYVHKTDQ